MTTDADNAWLELERCLNGSPKDPWLRLDTDGARAVVVFLGVPFHQWCHVVNGRTIAFTEAHERQGYHPELRVSINVALYNDPGAVRIWEMNAQTAKELIRVRNKYNFDRWAFEIIRHGAANDPNGSFSILPEESLVGPEFREMERRTLHDMPTVYAAQEARYASLGLIQVYV